MTAQLAGITEEWAFSHSYCLHKLCLKSYMILVSFLDLMSLPQIGPIFQAYVKQPPKHIQHN